MNYEGIIAVLRKEIKKTGSIRKWAHDNGVSRPFVSNVLAGRFPIGPKILGILGFEKVETYRRVK